MAYRRRKGSRIWHFCRNCPYWPVTDYEEWLGGPPHGHECEKCHALVKAGIGWH